MTQSKQRQARRRTEDGDAVERTRTAAKPSTPRPRKPSLTASLAATHKHTVPVLPALDPPGDDAQDDGLSRRPATSYARATLAPGPSGVRRAPTNTPPTGGAAKRASRRPPHETAADSGRILMERAHFDDADDRDDRDDRDDPGGNVAEAPTARMPEARDDIAEARTALVPARDHDRLPAARPTGGPTDLALSAATGAADTILIRGSRKPPKPYLMPVVPRRLGPRPFVVQFLIAMVTAMTLFGSLAIASPLGRSAVFGPALDAYANAVPWIPTPTPTPRPTATPIPLSPYYSPQNGPNPGQATVIAEIQSVFGQYSQGALNISRCESGYDPNARNPYPVGDSHAMGVFQILYPSTWATTSYSAYSPYDYKLNIRAAWEIFSRDGHSWVEWECKSY